MPTDHVFRVLRVRRVLRATRNVVTVVFGTVHVTLDRRTAYMHDFIKIGRVKACNNRRMLQVSLGSLNIR